MNDEMVEPLYEREIGSAPGPFYVVKEMCITCSLPVETASENIAYHKRPCNGCSASMINHCFVFEQPKKSTEIENMIAVVAGSCVAAYRYCGTDPDILARLVKVGCADQCDALVRKSRKSGRDGQNVVSSRKAGALLQLLWPAAGILIGAMVTINFAPAVSIPLWMGVAAWFGAMLLVPAIAGSRAGARVAAFGTGAAFAIPFFVHATAFGRFLLAACLALPFAGAANLMLVPPIAGFRNRLAFIGTWGRRLPQRAERRFDARALLRLAVATIVLAAAIGVVKAVPASGYWYLARWFAGGVAALACGEMATAGPQLFMSALGVKLPAMMRSPYRAASLTEFWTKRWNIAASELFHKFIFVPLARFGPGMALIAVFALSALAHAFLVNLALRRVPIALANGAFFLVQPLFLFIERRIGVRRWPRAMGRAWTLTVLAVTLPLFIEGALQIVEPSWQSPNTVLTATLGALGIVVGTSVLLFGLPLVGKDKFAISNRQSPNSDGMC